MTVFVGNIRGLTAHDVEVAIVIVRRADGSGFSLPVGGGRTCAIFGSGVGRHVEWPRLQPGRERLLQIAIRRRRYQGGFRKAKNVQFLAPQSKSSITHTHNRTSTP